MLNSSLSAVLKSLDKRYLEELKELFSKGEIASGKLLNDSIAKNKGERVINYQVPPAYNLLNLNRETVFCHLNPGGDPSPESFQKKIKQFKSADEFIEDYLRTRMEYASNRFISRGEFDNFDYKQALFLAGFPNNGVELRSITKNEILKDPVKRSFDCYSVLQNKTQLELIPFESRKFKSLFHSMKASRKVFPFIEMYFVKMMQIIASQPRKYVIFGSDQYANLMNVANDTISEFSISRTSGKIGLDIGTKNKAYVTIMKLRWKEKCFDAVLAHSFPRQDLPNAFEKMQRYGEKAYEALAKFKKSE